MENYGEIWSKHWYDLNKRGSLFGQFCRAYRILIRAKTLNSFFERYFPKTGVFVECGSGSSQTSSRILKSERLLYALDISREALEEATKVRVLDGFVKADIKKLPFKEGSIDGIWNLGVIEHYKPDDRETILGEFHWAMKPGGTLLMFWPSWHALDKYILGILQAFFGLFLGRDFRFFPDEPCRLGSKKEGIDIMTSMGFTDCEVHFPMGDLFTEYVVICKKPRKNG
jgi:SAM-dependent methyltransferase